MAKARPWSCSGPRYWYSDPLAEKTLIRNGPKSPDPVMPPPTIFSTSSDWKRRAPTQEKISAPSETVTSNLNRSVQNRVICGSIFGSCTSAQLLTRTAGIASNLDRRTVWTHADSGNRLEPGPAHRRDSRGQRESPRTWTGAPSGRTCTSAISRYSRRFSRGPDSAARGNRFLRTGRAGTSLRESQRRGRRAASHMRPSLERSDILTLPQSDLSQVRQQRLRVIGDDGIHLRRDQAPPVAGTIGRAGDHFQACGMRRVDLPGRGQRVIGCHDPRFSPVRDRDEAPRRADIQRSETDLGRQPPDGVQYAEIEGLHDHPLFQFVPPDRLAHQIGETFRGRRQSRAIRETLDFNVEEEMAAVRQVEHLVERGHARAWDERLLWEARVPHGAAVPAFEFGKSQVPDDARRVGRLADRPVQLGIVRNHDHVVASDRHVHLQRIRAHGDGVFKSRQSVFRPHGARATVAVY